MRDQPVALQSAVMPGFANLSAARSQISFHLMLNANWRMQPRFPELNSRQDTNDDCDENLHDKTAGTGVEAGVPCSPINRVDDVLTDPQVAARNMVIRAMDPVAGEVKMAGNPIKLSAYPDPVERPPAPELDQHRRARADGDA